MIEVELTSLSDELARRSRALVRLAAPEPNAAREDQLLTDSRFVLRRAVAASRKEDQQNTR